MLYLLRLTLAWVVPPRRCLLLPLSLPCGGWRLRLRGCSRLLFGPKPAAFGSVRLRLLMAATLLVAVMARMLLRLAKDLLRINLLLPRGVYRMLLPLFVRLLLAHMPLVPTMVLPLVLLLLLALLL